jgi:LemA protein
MSGSLIFWTSAAVLLFWAVGAYNRLVRLRAAVNQAFAAVDALMREQVELVLACVPVAVDAADAAGAADDPDQLLDDMSSLWTGLRAAAEQFRASLAAARARPLSADGMAALDAAQQVLHMAWQRMQQEDAHDLAGSALPEHLQTRWRELAARIQDAVGLFNHAVDDYNAAIRQFPALLLASLYGFAPARTL